MRVLICDDEPDVQLLLELNVAALGHEAITVGDGWSAIAACETDRPDMLLADVTMPEMDGPTLVRSLRARGIEPRNTMLVSAITPEELRHIAQQLGVRWMSKPFTFDNVRTALQDMD